MSRDKRERLREKLSVRRGGISIKEREAIEKRNSILNTLKAKDMLSKHVESGIFDELEYKYFTKYQFIKYLELLSEDGSIFDTIDQSIVDSLATILRENSTYEAFVSDHNQEWVESGGAMCAFKYIFDCKNVL